MVVYNELVAITAGAGLLGFAWFLNPPHPGQAHRQRRLGRLLRRHRPAAAGAGSAHHGDLALRRRRLRVRQHRLRPTRRRVRRAAALRRRVPVAPPALFAGDVEEANATALAALKPVGIFVGALGLGMAVLAITFVRFQLGAAPPEEPISGRFGHLPILEALFLGGLWGVVAVGALLFAIALLTDRPQLLRWAVRAWVVGGAVFLLFGAMNFYTHIGMYYNIAHGTTHKW